MVKKQFKMIKKFRLSIKQKIQIYILITSVLVYLFAIGYISMRAFKNSYDSAVERVDNYAAKYAAEIENELNTKMAVIRTLAQAFVTYSTLGEDKWKSLFMSMQGEVFKGNPHLYSIWDSWELSKIDSLWDKPHGRYAVTWWRENNQILNRTSMRSLEGDPPLYAAVKSSEVEAIWEPYMDQVVDGKAKVNLMLTLSVPIMEENNFTGLVAADITLETLQNLVGTIQPFDESFAFLVSNKGRFASHPNVNFHNKLLTDHYTREDNVYDITGRILKGESFSHIKKNLNEEYYYNSFAPIDIGNTNTPWSLGISVPLRVINSQANRNLFVSAIIGFAGLIILFTVTLKIAGKISGSLRTVTQVM